MKRNQLRLNSRVYASITALGIAAFISGCSKKEQQPVAIAPVVPPAVQQLTKPVQKPVSSAVRLDAPPLGNQFDFSNKKDPFKPLVLAKVAAVPSSDELKKALKDGLPIHGFDVSQFKLIGIVMGGKENQAMVVDPNGKGYVLKTGMSIGKNDGRIVSINSGGVDVIEQFKDDNGRVRKENIKITLPRKQ